MVTESPKSPAPTTGSASILRTRLAELDKEMAALQSRLRLLTSERNVVLCGLERIVYPVLTLPPEITGKIFSHYVENPHIGYTSEPGRGPLLLASVCRSWRDICLSLRHFWSSLRMFPPNNPGLKLDNFLSLAECWLARAGDDPLELEISRSLSTQTVLSFLSRRSCQWRTLSFALRAPHAFPNAEITSRVPLLTTLSISMSMDNEGASGGITAFHDAPSLREVKLSVSSPRCISLPWRQLTFLELTTTDLYNCLDVLGQTQDLQVLIIYLTHRTLFISHEESSPFDLAHLHTLKFLYSGDGSLLDYLTLPALETLQCSYLNDEGANRLMSLALRSSWSLRCIHFSNCPSRTYIPCLRYIPSVERVEIDHRQHTALPLFELLRTDTVDFLPALRMLTVTDGSSDISSLAIPEMLLARRSGATPNLRSFTFFFSGKPVANRGADGGIRDSVRGLVSDGLNVELTEY